jgi:SET domain-containing protein
VATIAAVTSWLDPKVEVRVSPIEGRGLFANASIESGEQLTVRDDTNFTIMTDDEFQEFVSTVSSWDAEALGDGRHRVSMVRREDEPTNFANHSCEPNGTVKDRGLVAVRGIAPDEEVTVDYSLVSSRTWTMQCNCQASTCRGLVRGVL